MDLRELGHQKYWKSALLRPSISSRRCLGRYQKLSCRKEQVQAATILACLVTSLREGARKGHQGRCDRGQSHWHRLVCLYCTAIEGSRLLSYSYHRTSILFVHLHRSQASQFHLITPRSATHPPYPLQRCLYTPPKSSSAPPHTSHALPQDTPHQLCPPSRPAEQP